MTDRYLYHYVNDNHMMYGSWDMEHDRHNFFFILDHFLPFYPTSLTAQKFAKMKKTSFLHICTINDNHMMHIWFLRQRTRWTEFFVILDWFLPFYPPNNWENQSFENMKIMPWGVILHMCTINDNHVMIGYWDMGHDRPNF